MPKKMNTPIRETKGADIVVIGSGATGMAAALTAAEQGVRVIILEKMANTGGTSNFPEGMFAVESEMQREQYIDITRDEAFKIIMDYSHWKANPRLVRAFVNESAGTISWLQELGAAFDGPMAIFPNGPRTWHLFKGPKKARASVMMKTLTEKARKKGIDIQVKTSARELIKEGILTESAWQKIEKRVEEEIEAAVNYSEKECTIPDPAEILRGVYAES